MVAIIMETEYSGSVWGGNLYKSLVNQLRQKRIPFCEIEEEIPVGTKQVFVIGGNYRWIRSVIEQLNRAGYQPVLICNQYEDIPGCLYSCVCSDVNASMRGLLNMLRQKEQRKVALYGVGTGSVADLSRANSLFSWRDGEEPAMEVFYNHGSLAECFHRFFGSREDFDAVICANDYAAVSLYRNLKARDPESAERLQLVSCAGTRISELYRDGIISLSMNFEPYGKAAIYIYECMQKDPFVSAMTVKIRWSLDESRGEETSGLVLKRTQMGDQFYEDPEIGAMLMVDKFLCLSEMEDRHIFLLLLQGWTYEQIAQECFLTESTVKYRVKRLVKLCGAEDRNELIQQLKEYTQGRLQ